MVSLLARIADALDRLAPPPPSPPALDQADAFIWRPPALVPVPKPAALDLPLLRGIDAQAASLIENTRRFAAGRPANNAMLWGARGMGKSSLVKAVHRAVLEERPGALVLVEIARTDLGTLPDLLAILRDSARRFLLFCDDLSFEAGEPGYKSLKSVLEGGIEGRPDNVLLYATSNRRHLLPREAIENESGTALHPGEAVEEKVSLSDRFGLWLGFHPCDQATYLAMVDAYADAAGLALDRASLHERALRWAATRGARSGRVAWQFMQSVV